ncbi:UNVERIFIED_CONTAM: Serine carboxypeptidase-like 13, partial [Sesamum angustifolium]
GDHDAVVPYLATLKWIRHLNLTVYDDWRAWMVNDQVAGRVPAIQLQNTNQWSAWPWLIAGYRLLHYRYTSASSISSFYVFDLLLVMGVP